MRIGFGPKPDGHRRRAIHQGGRRCRTATAIRNALQRPTYHAARRAPTHCTGPHAIYRPIGARWSPGIRAGLTGAAAGATVPAMGRMFRRLWVIDSNSRPAVRLITLPLVPALVDGVRYLLEQDIPPPETRDMRKLRRSRAPSLRSMVRLAVAMDDADQMERALRRRLERDRAPAAPSPLELAARGDLGPINRL